MVKIRWRAQFFFARGARQQNVDQMFLAALAGFRRFGRADGFGHVAGEWNSESFGLLCDRKIRFARQAVIDLEKIRACGRQQSRPPAGLHRLSRLRRHRA